MKKSRLIIGVVIVVILIAIGLAWKLFSDFLGRKAGEAITESIIEQSTGGSIEISSDDDAISFQSEDGSASFSSGTTLPQGFPNTVPTPSFGTIIVSYASTTDTGEGYTVTYSLTATEAATANTTYQSQFTAAGYAIEGTAASTATSGSINVFTAKKDNITAGVTITSNEDGTAALNLTVSIESAN